MPAGRIEGDNSKYHKIIRGKIRKDLRKYITHGEMIGRQGKETVSIPLPQIDIPTFRFGPQGAGGVGQGEGDVGNPFAPGPYQPGQGGAGELPGEHILEVDISLEELASILGEELELPRIEPKGKKEITSLKDKYTGIRNVGPESLRHGQRTYKEALKRQIGSGEYDYNIPRIVPIRDDKRYRSWEVTKDPQSNAVILYMMDVSGSMGDEQKEIVRIETFWIDTWLRSQYDGVETRYIIHDASAKEVDRDTFYHTRESGGTKISTAYTLCNKIIEANYPVKDWNMYAFHFSDGDNWGGGDTKLCVDILKEQLIPKLNLFCYGQVQSAYGTGEFKKDLDLHLKDLETVITSDIVGREGIYDSIKEFLGKGK